VARAPSRSRSPYGSPLFGTRRGQGVRDPGRRQNVPAVLYIGGFSRSGSTLLSYLLGALEQFCTAGELREVWTKGLLHDNLCTCGERFSVCPFWTAVGDAAFGGWHRTPIEELAATSESIATDTHLVPAVATGRCVSARLRRFRAHAVRVYEAIGALTGCSVIVDSSKVAPYAMLLESDPAIRLSVIQLVRDSRAVAFSWARRGVIKPDVEGLTATMDTYASEATALRWSYHNALFDSFSLRSIPLARIRYEALVHQPATEIGRSLSRLGFAVDPETQSDLRSGSVSLGTGHAIGGNPMRFRGSEQSIQLDDEWRRAMPRGMRRRVTLLTWPLLVRYGYIA
jgi:hypothetical protein